jgi:iron complex transport system substrate-binding protein
MRICSLLPSATEIVAELGLAHSLVGISEECDWPPEVRDLPVVTASRVDTRSLSSLEIDEAVRTAVGDGRPLYAIDRELLEELEPDVILTQNLCAVCAVSADHVNELCATDAEVVALDANTLAEIEERIVSLSDLLGVSGRGHTVVAEMEAKIAVVRARVADARTRSIFVAEWVDPPFAAGHWIPEMVEIAGGRDVLGHAGAPSYPTSWEAVRHERPELVVVAPCGLDHERAARETTLPPVACRAVAVDSNAYYARPAPRLADGVVQLAFLMHPDRVDDPGLPYVELADRASTGAEVSGVVEAIHVAAAAGEPVHEVGLVHAKAGAGLEGDRYALGRGHYSLDRRVSRDLTLIEAEAIESLAREHDIALAPGETRRNVTTRGIRLNDLVGRRFWVGDVLCEGTRLCEPCSYLAELTGKPLLRALAHRGGLRADILRGGLIRRGDRLQVGDGRPLMARPDVSTRTEARGG